MSPADLNLLRSAYAVADAAHAGTERISGEPYIEHPIAVATILAELAIDVYGIAAALLHDTVEDTYLTLDEVENQFGTVVARIVDGVTKISGEVAEPASGKTETAAQHRARKARQRSETVRKLLLAMGADLRVALVKIADRLHNLRTMEKMLPAQREVKARETLEIYAPLTGRLGLYLIKSELEDRAFFFLEPEAYRKAEASLLHEARKRDDWAQHVAEITARALASRGIPASINWRVKHLYRSHREAQDNGMRIAELHDLIAFRVLVSDRDDCYQALGAIHSLGRPYDRIRDYIAEPKNNEYQSLHTAVFTGDERLAQFHIRTHEMHRAAQHGLATTWLEPAALGKRVDESAPIPEEKVLSWVKQLITWHEELEEDAETYVDTVQGDLLEEQVVVSSPKGEPYELPEGSTVLDFAYRIHTQIGDRAAGAEIRTNSNEGALVNRFVPIDYVLQRGDIVRVITAPEGHPAPDWPNIAKTRYARMRIFRALRLRQRTDTERTRHRDEPPGDDLDRQRPLRHPSGRPARIELARCCYPCPGDTIVGLVKTRNQVSIHRNCCHTLRRILDRRGEALAMAVSWRDIAHLPYRVHLLLGGEDHEGLMRELSTWAARMGLNISGTRAGAIQSRFKAAVTLTLDIPPTMQENLVTLMHRLQRAVPSITTISRDAQKGCEPEPC